MLSNAIMGAGGTGVPELTFEGGRYNAAKSADLDGRSMKSWSMTADGTKGYSHDGDNRVTQFNFSTPFDMSTLTSSYTYSKGDSVSNTFKRLRGFSMNAGGDHAMAIGVKDGTPEPNMYTVSNGNLLGMVNMNTGPDPSSVDNHAGYLGSCYLASDGSFYIIGSGQNTTNGIGQLLRVDMPNPYNRQTSVLRSITTAFPEMDSQVRDITFSPDGLMMALVGWPSVANYGKVYRYELTTPYDPTTATLVEPYVFPEIGNRYTKGIEFRADMRGFMVLYGNDTVGVYDL